MNVWETGIYTGVIVVAGTVTKPDHKPPVELLAYAVFYTLFLIGLQSIDEDLAQAMAYLVLIVAILQYGTAVTNGLGVTKGA